MGYRILAALAAIVALILLVRELRSYVCIGDKCRTIEAMKIEPDADNKLTGKFVIKRAHRGAIPSDRIGGACLFADRAAFQLPPIDTQNGLCSVDEHCEKGLKEAPFKNLDWEGLCHRGTGTCWVRPGSGKPGQSALCNIDPFKARDDDHEYDSNAQPFDPSTLDNPLTLAPAAKNKPIKMRVVACLNGVFTGEPPCHARTPNRILTFGPISEFKTGQ